MKKWIALMLCAVLVPGALCGCGGERRQDTDKIQVVATVFPLYDWARELIGQRREQVELTLLLDHGVDMHSYQPSVEDMIKVSDCDVFIYVGGESDQWVDDALGEAANQDMIAANLLELLGAAAKEEETVEGMEQEEEDGEETAYDEHIWLSLRNASLLCRALAEVFAAADPDGAAVYRANAAAYIEKLEALDSAYQEAVDGAGGKTVLFADRFPFRYLADDYGLTYYAAFAGCSAQAEAGFETVVFLAQKIDALGLRYILQTETADGTLAQTVRGNTAAGDQTVLTLDSMQSVTAQDAASGTTYLTVMENNLRVLKEALQ